MITLSCFAENNVVVYWLEKIGNGGNLCEPHAPYDILTKDISAYIRKIGSPDPTSFLSCMAILDKNYMYESNVNWASIRGFQLKNAEKDLIAKVLARRAPIINEYEHDKAVYSDGLPRLMYRIGSTIQEDYWGMFQFCVIDNLIEENDTRFEREVKDLVDYLLAPLLLILNETTRYFLRKFYQKQRWSELAGAEDIDMYLNVEYTDQCNFTLEPEFLKIVSQLSIPVSISCYPAGSEEA